MLILTRKPGEEIVIRVDGREIRVTLVMLRKPEKEGGNWKVRIGVQADDDVAINRAEVDQAKEREKASQVTKTAATATPA